MSFLPLNSTAFLLETGRRWRLALAIWAAVLGISAAQGQVTYINFADLVLTDPNPVTYDNPTAYVEFNLIAGTITHTNAGTLPYMRFSAVDDEQDLPQTFNAFRTSSTGLFMKTGVPITAGTTINSASGFGTFASMQTGYNNLTDVFVGFRIDAGGGNYNYGWMRFTTGADYGGHGPGTITIFDAAYENTLNLGIVAGSITSIPEPSIAVLWIGLAAGALALHRRRHARDATGVRV